MSSVKVPSGEDGEHILGDIPLTLLVAYREHSVACTVHVPAFFGERFWSIESSLDVLQSRLQQQLIHQVHQIGVLQDVIKHDRTGSDQQHDGGDPAGQQSKLASEPIWFDGKFDSDGSSEANS